MTRADYAYEVLQDGIRAEGGIVPCQNYPDLFFPETHDNGGSKDYSPTAAKKLCRECPVLLECADYAIEAEEEYGVWGGMSANERRKLRARKTRR